MLIMRKSTTRAAAAAPNAMQRALSASAAAKIPVPTFVRAAAYQVPFCPRLACPPRPAPSKPLCSSYFATPCTSY